MKNLWAMIGIRKTDIMRNKGIRKLVDVCKKLDEVMNERPMWWYKQIKE